MNQLELLNSEKLDKGIIPNVYEYPYSPIDGVITQADIAKLEEAVKVAEIKYNSIFGNASADISRKRRALIELDLAKKNLSEAKAKFASQGTPKVVVVKGRPISTSASSIKDIKKEPKVDESEGKSASTDSTDTGSSSDDNKILGMPKGLAIGLGVLILAIGGYFTYKKFKK